VGLAINAIWHENDTVRRDPVWSTGSKWRSIPKLINLIFLLVFVSLVSPVNGIFLSIPGLCRTENLPKLFSFIGKRRLSEISPVQVMDLLKDNCAQNGG
jgi:hypothetical protein